MTKAADAAVLLLIARAENKSDGIETGDGIKEDSKLVEQDDDVDMAL